MITGIICFITGVICSGIILTVLIIIKKFKTKKIKEKHKPKIALDEYNIEDKYINWKNIPTEIPIFKNKNEDIINTDNLIIMWNPKKRFWVLVEKVHEFNILPGEIALLSEKECNNDNIVFYYSTVPEPGNKEGLLKLKEKFPNVKFFAGKVIFEG